MRLGAIYTLAQITQDFPELAGAVRKVLSEYLRSGVADYGDAEAPPDVQEMAQILTTGGSGERT